MGSNQILDFVNKAINNTPSRMNAGIPRTKGRQKSPTGRLPDGVSMPEPASYPNVYAPHVPQFVGPTQPYGGSYQTGYAQPQPTNSGPLQVPWLGQPPPPTATQYHGQQGAFAQPQHPTYAPSAASNLPYGASQLNQLAPAPNQFPQGHQAVPQIYTAQPPAQQWNPNYASQVFNPLAAGHQANYPPSPAGNASYTAPQTSNPPPVLSPSPQGSPPGQQASQPPSPAVGSSYSAPPSNQPPTASSVPLQGNSIRPPVPNTFPQRNNTISHPPGYGQPAPHYQPHQASYSQYPQYSNMPQSTFPQQSGQWNPGYGNYSQYTCGRCNQGVLDQQ